MILNDSVYLIALAALAAVIGVLLWQWLKRRGDYARLRDRVHRCTDGYAFLIDCRFRVRETNYYELNQEVAVDQPYVLGNVLHCQTAIDEGLCGTGIDCDTCPIRMVINNAFKLRRNFDHIEAVVYLYDAHRKAKEMDVCVDGELVYVGKQPHLIVTARQAGTDKIEQTNIEGYDLQ